MNKNNLEENTSRPAREVYPYKIDKRTKEGRHFARATPRHPKFEKCCTYCGYTWIARKLEVLACPRCKRRFDYPQLRELMK